MKNVERFYVLIALGIAGCAAETTEILPESTTTTIEPSGGVAKSADGLMELHFAAGSLIEARAITIETRRDVAVDRLASLVYRVSPSPLAAPLEVWFHTDADVQIGAVDSGQFEPISGTEREGHNVRVSMSGLPYSMLAAVENDPIEEPQVQPEGWDDVPATGPMFILNAFELAADGGALAGLGAFLNDDLAQQLQTGGLLVLVEIAGLDAGFIADDDSVTVKFYGAVDIDDPLFPANDFSVPPGQSTCCEFLIDAQSLANGLPPIARSRAPGRIAGGRLETLAPVPLQLVFRIGAPPYPEVRIERMIFTADLDASLQAFNNGRIEGAMPMNTLAQIENTSCKQPGECAVQYTDSTLLDLATTLLRVEVDVDLDVPANGLSCVIDTDGDGRIDRCCNSGGAGTCHVDTECTNGTIEAIGPGDPSTCALNAAAADGFSVAFGVTGVHATAAGFAP